MDWNSPLATAILAAIVSFLVGILFSDKSVERSQLRRHHSRILQSSLQTWMDSIESILVLGRNDALTTYSHEEKEILPVEISNLERSHIPHKKYLQNHLETGYKDIWDYWKTLFFRVQEHNIKKAKLCEYVRQQLEPLILELELTEHYYKIGRNRPRCYIAPDKIVESIIDEIEKRLKGWENWYQGDPKIEETWYGQTLVYHLTVINYSYLMHDTNQDNISPVIEFLNRMVKDESIIGEVEELNLIYDENDKKATNLKDEIKEVISIIELGKNIEGNCDHCPTLFGIF